MNALKIGLALGIAALCVLSPSPAFAGKPVAPVQALKTYDYDQLCAFSSDLTSEVLSDLQASGLPGARKRVNGPSGSIDTVTVRESGLEAILVLTEHPWFAHLRVWDRRLGGISLGGLVARLHLDRSEIGDHPLISVACDAEELPVERDKGKLISLQIDVKGAD